MKQFVGRSSELAFLENKYSTEEAELIVVYGRRRVGKTELIHQFSSGRPHVYYQCEKADPEIALSDFQAHIADAIGIAEYYCNRLKLAQG